MGMGAILITWLRHGKQTFFHFWFWRKRFLKGFYEGKSISNQPIPFPIDRDTQDFHALFQHVLGLRAKLHPYHVIHS